MNIENVSDISPFGAPVAGELEEWFETGLEGVVWALIESGRKGYAGLHVIEEGDHLTIIDRASNVLWQGIIECDREIGRRSRPPNSKLIQQTALGCWVHWIQRGFEPDAWAKFFIRADDDRLSGVLCKRRVPSSPIATRPPCRNDNE